MKRRGSLVMVLVTGGASSGKSAFAERLCVQLGGDRVYLATMHPFGEEGAQRVARHRLQRAGKGFDTVECYGRLQEALDAGRLDGATVLLEDLGNVVSNEMFGDGTWSGRLMAAQDIVAMAASAAHLVVVGNEVGCDGARYAPETRRYQQELGRLACQVAAASDAVVECIAGVPIVVKATSSGDVAMAIAAATEPYGNDSSLRGQPE